jgi:hypothetical protein
MRRFVVFAGISAIAAGGALVGVASPASSGGGSQSVFSFVEGGGGQDCVVAEGVENLTISAFGAQGGATSNAGGLGGRVVATVPVTAGETLKVFVGGTDGTNGGGGAGDAVTGSDGKTGGGASDVRRTPYGAIDRIVVAGGGGGGGGQGFSAGGTGGGGGDGSAADGGSAGAGGQGGQGGYSGGFGGPGFAGGANGAPGTTGQGGAGGNGEYDGGGGGGGGATGGGGGGGNSDFSSGAGGGGGGSSAVLASLDPPSFTTGVREGNGLVTISPACASFGAQPDGQVRKGTSLPFQGVGVYDPPTVQKITTNVPGNTQTFQYRVENDGDAPASFTLSASPGAPKIVPKYLVGATNITAELVAGTYVTPELDPGERITITLNLNAKNATNGTKYSFTLNASDGTLTDRTTATVKIT